MEHPIYRITEFEILVLGTDGQHVQRGHAQNVQRRHAIEQGDVVFNRHGTSWNAAFGK